MFESLVNSRRCKTHPVLQVHLSWFESLVNSRRCKIISTLGITFGCLRALLIQNNIFIPILPSQADNPIITELE